jgi:hypothetical protein
VRVRVCVCVCASKLGAFIRMLARARARFVVILIFMQNFWREHTYTSILVYVRPG